MKLKYISLFRVFAMFSIIACHIEQSIDHNIAFLLNGGVYGFLLISGMLFGDIIINNTKDFYFERLVRICVPYYYLVLAYIILYLALKISIDWQIIFNILGLQWFKSGIIHTGHLWYITCILICYMLVPIYQKIFSNKYFNKEFFWIAMILIAIICVLISSVIPINILYFYIFFLGYVYSKCYRKIQDIVIDRYEKSIILIGYVTMLARIIIEFVLHLDFPSLLGDVVEILFSLAFLNSLRVILSKYQNLEKRILNPGGILYHIDTISYEIYLTHHIFILGVLSVIKLTNYMGINVIIALIFTLLTAELLHMVASVTTKKIMNIGKLI